MLNGGFKNEYSNNDDVNKFLKDFELEIKNIQNKFYEIDNRFDNKTIFNYKGKSLSRNYHKIRQRGIKTDTSEVFV